jgi:nitrate/nitrite-specific signal transduction histidine kinase
MKIRSTDPQFVFVFTASKDENGLYFVVDAGEPGEEGIAAFGERYDDPSETLAANYDTMTSAVVDPEIYTDRFGSFISGYAPIFSSSGERVGVIGIDIDAGTIVQERERVFTQTLIIVFFAGLASILLGYFFGNILTNSIEKLASDTTKFAEGDFSVRTDVRSLDEVGKLGRSFNNMADQIQSLVSGLEQRVAARTKDLAIVAEISTTTAAIRDPFQMLATMVHLNQRRFNYYHSHVFTYHKESDDLQIVACGYREGDVHEGTHGTAVIPISQEQSLVARAARTRKPVIVNDVQSDPGWLPNPLLPETRAEMVVPMIVGDEVLGVLDVQADHVDAFTEEDANIQLTLAAQIATSYQNALTYNQTKQQADFETLFNLISQKIQRATTVEDTLQTAIRELSAALGAPRAKAMINLTPQGDIKSASDN